VPQAVAGDGDNDLVVMSPFDAQGIGGVSAARGYDASEGLVRRYQPFWSMTDQLAAPYGQTIITSQPDTGTLVLLMRGGGHDLGHQL
jgi:hypothetical protein